MSCSLDAIDFRELQHLFCVLDYTQQAYLEVSNFLQMFGIEESSSLKPPDTHSLGGCIEIYQIEVTTTFSCLPELLVPLTQAIENVLELWGVANNVPCDR